MVGEGGSGQMRCEGNLRALWGCGGEVWYEGKMDLNEGGVGVVAVGIHRDMGQLCIENWISLILQNN